MLWRLEMWIMNSSAKKCVKETRLVIFFHIPFLNTSAGLKLHVILQETIIEFLDPNVAKIKKKPVTVISLGVKIK